MKAWVGQYRGRWWEGRVWQAGRAAQEGHRRLFEAMACLGPAKQGTRHNAKSQWGSQAQVVMEVPPPGVLGGREEAGGGMLPEGMASAC